MTKNELKKYSVSILGEDYSLVSDEAEEHIAEAANYVHILLQEASRKAPYNEPKRLAVLVALKLASELCTKQAITKRHEERTAELLHTIDNLIVQIAARE